MPQLRPDQPASDSFQSGSSNESLNVLLVGVDGFGEEPSYRLADSVLLVHIPADRSRPYLVSLPRDLEVSVPGRGPTSSTARSSPVPPSPSPTWTPATTSPAG
ncbi:hypothetical protein NKG94_35085 [Micromonospora sp. M12]